MGSSPKILQVEDMQHDLVAISLNRDESLSIVLLDSRDPVDDLLLLILV